MRCTVAQPGSYSISVIPAGAASTVQRRSSPSPRAASTMTRITIAWLTSTIVCVGVRLPQLRDARGHARPRPRRRSRRPAGAQRCGAARHCSHPSGKRARDLVAGQPFPRAEGHLGEGRHDADRQAVRLGDHLGRGAGALERARVDGGDDGARQRARDRRALAAPRVGERDVPRARRSAAPGPTSVSPCRMTKSLSLPTTRPFYLDSHPRSRRAGFGPRAGATRPERSGGSRRPMAGAPQGSRCEAATRAGPSVSASPQRVAEGASPKQMGPSQQPAARA